MNFLRRLLAAFVSAPAAKRVNVAVDLPEARSSTSGTLVIRGWAFSRNGTIVQVQARLGEREPRLLLYGFPRADVARGFSYPDAARSGFEGTLTFEPVAADRVDRLVVSVTDDRGERAEAHVAVRVVVPPRAASLGPSVVRTPRASATSATTRLNPDIERHIREAVNDTRERVNREPTILDWQCHLPFSEIVPDAAVCSPPDDEAPLPYLDGTIDIVAVNGRVPSRLAEACRVAAIATFDIRLTPGEPASVEGVVLQWQPGAPARNPEPAISIVIPVYNQVAHTEACLRQVTATLPAGFRGEILVVDDGSSDETPEVLRRWAGKYTFLRVVRQDENVGFLHSCNRGADAATGEILVLLNNDTLPQPGWLPPLVHTLRYAHAAGAVGGKLLYPDGTLQEAGGVVFLDGTGCNFGKRDSDPRAPLYNFVREVDYCSGALLAIWRSVWLELGGFDTRYSPAYYEDTDLCFRLRERGYRVYYQPDSVIVHVEGATSGIDPGAGSKQYQAVNLEKFRARWATALTQQPAPPMTMDRAARLALSVRDGRPRVLVCTPGLPEYDRESGSQRTSRHIEFLKDAGWAVSVVALDSQAAERYRVQLRQRGVATYAPADARSTNDTFLDEVDALVTHGRFDLALVAFWDVAERLLPHLRARSPLTRVIVDSIDLHFLRDARGVLRRSPGRARGTLGPEFADRLIREMNVYAAADAVLTVSQKEADLLNDITADPSLALSVPLAESLPRSPFGFADRRGLLFIGNFRHPPNLEGLEFLCHEILPRLDLGLLSKHPLSVVGNEVDRRVQAVVADRRDVKLVGWVPSLVPYVERACVSVIPLLHGAGTKGKLIQALMVGTPSVSTRIGVEGLDLEGGEHVLVADSPDEFAAKIETLIRDAELWERLATQGRDRIVIRHGREAVQARFRSVIDGVMTRARVG